MLMEESEIREKFLNACPEKMLEYLKEIFGVFPRDFTLPTKDEDIVD
jgi:hypothetical protein